MNQENIMEKLRKIKVPHTFIILLGLILIVSALTYLIPAGVYDRYPDEATGRQLVDPNSYHTVDRNPTTLVEFFAAPVTGMVEAGYVVVLTFAVGSGVFVLEKAGIITGAIHALTKRLKGKGILVIPILMIVFALIDNFIGMCELTMVYVPIILPLMLTMGFDSMTAAATALIGSQIGFSLGVANPFTTIIGQKISGLPLMSGWQYRLLAQVAFMAVALVYVMRYAKKVQKDPASSIMYDIDLRTRGELGTSMSETQTLSSRQKLAGLASIGVFVLMILGVIQWGWDMPQIGAAFVAIGIIGGLIAGMSGDEISAAFIEGSTRVLEGALIIGVSRGIAVVMSNAQITDTIVHFFATTLQGIPGTFAAVGMMVSQTIIEFFISSGSGQAVATMPIMAPLSDVIGVTRQSAVLALQLGDGLTNILYPVSGYFMATIGLARVPYQKWVRFFMPLLLVEWAMAIALMIIAQLTQYGPF